MHFVAHKSVGWYITFTTIHQQWYVSIGSCCGHRQPLHLHQRLRQQISMRSMNLDTVKTRSNGERLIRGAM